MLVECGFTRAQAPDGSEWTFRPSLGRIAALGSPREIVSTFAELHGARAGEAAAYVLAVLCDQEDVTPLVGWAEVVGKGDARRLVRHPGAMPEPEQITIARHLMQHGICGKARPGGGGGGGGYAQEFHAAEHIAAAVAHLGVSHDEAAAMSMTQLQLAFEAKFPDLKAKRDVPTADEYAAFVKMMEERGHG